MKIKNWWRGNVLNSSLTSSLRHSWDLAALHNLRVKSIRRLSPLSNTFTFDNDDMSLPKCHVFNIPTFHVYSRSIVTQYDPCCTNWDVCRALRWHFDKTKKVVDQWILAFDKSDIRRLIFGGVEYLRVLLRHNYLQSLQSIWRKKKYKTNCYFAALLT